MGVLDAPAPAPNRPDPRVLFDTDFNNGLSGFVQLMDDTRPIGCLQLDTDYVYPGSRYAMLLSTEDYPWSSTRNWGSCTAIHRRGRGAVLGRVKFDIWCGYAGLLDANRPRAMRFGVDQAKANGDRRYFIVQWTNWDDNDLTGGSSGTSVRKLQVLVDKTGTGGSNRTFVDVPSGALNLGENEHKRNMHHFELVYDIDAGVYDGIRVDGTGYGGGSLADGVAGPAPVNAGSALRALGSPLAESLPVFGSGFNFAIDLVNRLNVYNSKSWMVVSRVRAELL